MLRHISGPRDMCRARDRVLILPWESTFPITLLTLLVNKRIIFPRLFLSATQCKFHYTAIYIKFHFGRNAICWYNLEMVTELINKRNRSPFKHFSHGLICFET